MFPEERVSARPGGEHQEDRPGGEHRVEQHSPLLPCLRVQTKEGQRHKVSPAIQCSNGTIVLLEFNSGLR